jgi:hypothetical protein
MEQILKLEKTDDITAIRSRIEFAFPPLAEPGQVVEKSKKLRLLVVVPRQNKALQSLVNMKLLARVASARAIELAIVSGQPSVRDYAKAAEVKAFGSLTAARWSGWVTSQTPVAPPEKSLPPVSEPMPLAAETTPANVGAPTDAAALSADIPAQPVSPTSPRQRVKKKKYVVVHGSGRVNIWQQLAALIALVGLAFVLVLGVVALLPEATVILTPVAKTVEAKLVVKADPQAEGVDYQTLTFPARPVQVELALPGQIETVETELAPTGQAQGVVTFINRTDKEQAIPISTTLSTSVGEQIKFIIPQTVTIPAGLGAITSTLVMAVEPGPKGNVQTGQINRFEEPSYALLARVINEQPFTGGTKEPTKVVVQADKERLQAHLRQQIQQEGLKKLQEGLGQQEFIPPESLEVIVMDVTYKEFAGDFSDTFNGEMQAVVRGTAVGGYNANQLALAALEAQVPPGFKLDVEGLHFAAGEVLNIQNRVVVFRVLANGKATPVIDPHRVAQDAAWLPIGEAQAKLKNKYNLATVPGVELKPAWLVDMVGRLPLVPLRINVIINNAVTLMADGN